MINYETLLSSYDNKLTLMKWLQKVEAALLNASLSSVSISQPTSDTAILTFVFADGSTLASPTLSLPAGPQGPQGVQGPQGPQGVKGPKGDTGAQGPKGDDGTSVRILEDADACTQLGDGYIDANGDLQVLTSLSPKTFTNAGHIQGPQGPQGEQGIQGIQGPQGIQGVQGIQGEQGPAGQNGTNGTNGTDGVSITNVSVNASNHLIVTLSSGSTIDAGEIQVSGGMSNPMTTQGDIIVGGASGTPSRLAKGTAGQVLAMNSDATGLEWTNAGGGGGSFIFHTDIVLKSLTIYDDGMPGNWTFIVCGYKNNVAGIYVAQGYYITYTNVAFVIITAIPSQSDFVSITQNALFDTETQSFVNTYAQLQNARGHILEVRNDCTAVSED